MIEKIVKYILGISVIITLISIIFPSNAGLIDYTKHKYYPVGDTIPDDDTIIIRDVDVPYPYQGKDNNPFTPDLNSPLFGPDPDFLSTEIEYDPETGEYIFKEKMGDMDMGVPYSVPFKDYLEYDFDKSLKDYWQQRAQSESFESYSSIIPKLNVGGEVFDMVFGGNTIDIRPQGAAELSFGLNISKVDNPTLPEKLRRTTTFDFQEKIQMNVVGQIGDKMKLNIQYDTEAAFDFENSVKLEYTGYDDEIIQKIEAGNVTLPLSGTLITGSQSLFGFKTELKFGRLTVTSIFSQQKGETSSIDVQGGAQTKEYEIYADQYEADKHYFLGHYFKENYDRFLSGLPIITSGVNITKIEVWITNRQGNFENSRNIVAFADLGENKPENIQSDYVYNTSFSNVPYTNDSANILADIEFIVPEIRNVNNVGNALLGIGMIGGVDYEKIESARLLSSNEYTVNTQLGYISLNSKLSSDQVLAVAYEYTVGGKVYRVGEFSNGQISAPDALILKLIKGTSFTPQMKVWDLMMKNIYSIGAYQVSSEDFWLDIYYKNDKTGTEINFVPDGAIDSTRLLTVLNLDNLNSQLDPYPDGMFDFINNITINPSNGRVIFPVREPFGSYLRKKITGGDQSLNEIADKYVFQELYDSTQSTARQIAEKNKFFIAGSYKSSSGSDISLNAINIPQGSVTVTAGAQVLQENVDYTVDYNLGRVKIINEGILESGANIKISLESNSLFNIQTKTLIGTHLNYEISRDFNVGATILNLTERPLTQKVSIGDEPISNTIWGVNASYRSELPWLTKAVDFLPFLETKEMSTVTITGEFAHLIPGHSKAIEKEGNAYIDDFEGSKTNIDIKSFNAWSLASVPHDPVMFPEYNASYILESGYNRAKLAWYVIDPLFHRTNSPVSAEEQSSHMVREVYENEIFPNKESVTGIPTNMAVLNLAYYPNEKGPYNYRVEGLNNDGTLQIPDNSWAGVMRKLETNDFEEANIEYIEFWMMDPFVEDSLNPGGDLYFNLGNVSEDILKDGRKSFEQGLPTPTNPNPVDTTPWGRVPLIQSLVNAFDNDPESRLAQDVGLDGLSDDDERSFFRTATGWHSYLDEIAAAYGEESQAYQKAVNDPSSDNFHYFRGSDYDDLDLGILERYKKYNGLEGNSPPAEASDESYSTSGTTVPNTEDVNYDNTLSENESYFQYRISIRKEDLVVGENYITDKIDYNAKFANNDRSVVTWYQFKIPIYSYDRRVGTIQDFKSIRFIRMFTKNFSAPTIMRMATLDLVRGEWRKYNGSFMQPGEYIVSELQETLFDVTAVNIEENGNKTPVNYILPPGINRQIDPTNPQLRQLNEQSMVLRVNGLQDGDGRAVYKNIDMDIRKYRRLKMFIHSESLPGEETLNDYDLSVFVRLGSDYKNNYYEYEIPIKVTAPGRYDGKDEYSADRYIVWPEENDLNLEFELLQKVKQLRNDDLRAGLNGVTLTRVYSMFDGKNKISVMGNPNLADVRTIMIGVRNPKKVSQSSDDDGFPKSGEIWVNELRLTDFDEKGGWAANARITTKLADFGSVTVAGATSKPGFGSISQKVSERQKEEIYRYDISSNLELGKFFPEKYNVRIPMYVGYSENISNPEYNPLDPDIPFSVAMRDPTLSDEEKQEIKYKAQDYNQQKSLNFTNVKVNKTDGPARIYDLANWSLSYGYNEAFSRNPNTEFNAMRNYTGALAYNYNATPKIVEPFKQSKLLSKPAFRIIKDFNFYYLPSQISFRTNLNRNYRETQLRNVYNEDVRLPISVQKDFNWMRQYDLRWNLTRQLKFDFSANNASRIDEPEGRMYKDDPVYEQKIDTIWNNLKNLGRNTHYHHTFNLTYTLPINKIPIFNWLTANVRYAGDYDWMAGPITADTIQLGNTVQNGNALSVNGQINMLSLYNKIGYLDEVNKKYRGRSRRPSRPQKETVTYEEDGLRLRDGRRKSVTHKLKTEEVTVVATTKDGKPIEVETEVIDKNRLRFTPVGDHDDARIVVTGSREKTESIAKIIFDNTLVLLMSVKNISIGYTQNNGTLLPGYMPQTYIMGISNYTPDVAMFGMQPSIQTPSIPFIMGWQDPDFGMWAAENHMITRDTTLASPFTMTHSTTWNVRASLEPVKDLRIDLTLNHNFSENLNEYYRYNQSADEFMQLNPLTNGSFSMTTITWRTAFEKIGKDGDYTSQSFQNFADYRIELAHRIASQRPDYDPNNVDEDGFPDGYSKTSQDVLMPAFLAAYTNTDPDKVTLSTFPSVLSALPNWRITYDGLGKIKALQKYFRTVNINHVYRSTYNIGSYTTRLPDLYNEVDGFNTIREVLGQNQEYGNYYSKHEINAVSITEQFSPLISVDMTMTNSFMAKIEVKKSRNLAMSFSNNQLTETKTDEFIIGTGYRFKDVEVIIKAGGRQRNYKSDLNIRLDFSLRNNLTIIRKLEEDVDQPTAGQNVVTIKFSADYVLSDRFNLRFFYDQVLTKPKISLSYPTSNTNFGLSLRFTLAG